MTLAAFLTGMAGGIAAVLVVALAAAWVAVSQFGEYWEAAPADEAGQSQAEADLAKEQERSVRLVNQLDASMRREADSLREVERLRAEALSAVSVLRLHGPVSSIPDTLELVARALEAAP